MRAMPVVMPHADDAARFPPASRVVVPQMMQGFILTARVRKNNPGSIEKVEITYAGFIVC